MDTRHRILLSLLLVLPLLATTSPARAADAVIAFDVAGGDTTGMRVQPAAGMTACAAGCAALRLRPGGAVPTGRQGQISFSAPAGTTIVSAELRLRWRTAQAAVSAHLQSLLGGRWVDQRRLRSAKGTSGAVTAGRGATAVAVTLTADAAVPARRILSEGENAVAVDGVTMTVRDVAPPAVSWSGAAPETGGWQRGALCGAFGASDAGLGVDRVDYVIGGAQATTGAPAGTRLQPRPATFAGTVCLDSTQLADGTYGTQLTATDTGPDGNRSAPVVGIARIDNTAPAVSYQAPADPEARLPQATLTVADPASGLAGVTATIDGIPAVLRTAGAVTTVVPSASLVDGTHVLAWQAADVAGNTATGRELIGVLDATPPVVDDAQPQGVALPTAAVTAHATDMGSGVDPGAWRVAVDGVDMTGAAEIAPSGTLTLTPVRPWGEGEHVVRVTAADRSGNRSVRTWTFALPVTPPAPVAPPIASAPPTAPLDPTAAAVDPPAAGTADAVPAAQTRPAPRLRLTAERLRVRAGRETVLRGALTGVARRRVRIEARVGGTWRLVVALPVGADGTFTTPVRLPAAGGYDVRAVARGVRSPVLRLIAR